MNVLIRSEWEYRARVGGAQGELISVQQPCLRALVITGERVRRSAPVGRRVTVPRDAFKVEVTGIAVGLQLLAGVLIGFPRTHTVQALCAGVMITLNPRKRSHGLERTTGAAHAVFLHCVLASVIDPG